MPFFVECFVYCCYLKKKNNHGQKLSSFISDLLWCVSFYLQSVHRNMEANAAASHDYEDQDEYVLLDLDGVYDLIDIPPSANYVLTVSSLTCHIFH